MDLSSAEAYRVAQNFRSGGMAPVRQALLAARTRTLELADAWQRALAGSGMAVAYAPELNPPLWELGHLAWFQEYWIGRNLLRPLGDRADPLQPRGPSLLADADRWYDSSRVAHRSRWELPLPGPEATRDYLRQSFDQTLALLDQLPRGAGADALYFFRLVAAHEHMHAEAATYMARTLGIELGRAEPAPPGPGSAQGGVLRVPAQHFTQGSPAGEFAFDNEREAHRVDLASYEIDAQPVSWARFWPFAEAGGYQQRRWWSPQGWAWNEQQSRPVAPKPPPDWRRPAIHLSLHEAQAWCRWAGRRLPSEAEWECAAVSVPGFHWGQVWEWTATPFEPYCGFRPHPYRDYSAPWFGTRQVLRGASFATSPTLAHPRYRNFYEAHRNDIFAGFRSCA